MLRDVKTQSKAKQSVGLVKLSFSLFDGENAVLKGSAFAISAKKGCSNSLPLILSAPK